MLWYKIVIENDVSAETRLTDAFLDLLLEPSPGFRHAALWIQKSGVPKGQTWYYLEVDEPRTFQEFLDDWQGTEHAPPERTSLQPAAGHTRQ